MSKPKQLLKAEEVISHNGTDFEVVTVMVQTDENDNPTQYIYELITKEEADANRAANGRAQKLEAQRQAEQEASI